MPQAKVAPAGADSGADKVASGMEVGCHSGAPNVAQFGNFLSRYYQRERPVGIMMRLAADRVDDAPLIGDSLTCTLFTTYSTYMKYVTYNMLRTKPKGKCDIR